MLKGLSTNEKQTPRDFKNNKHKDMKQLFTYFILLICGFSIQAQTTTFFPSSEFIWIENFIGYQNNTGILAENNAIANSGDYDTKVSKWTLDATSVNTSTEAKALVSNFDASNTYFPNFVVENTNGELIWDSEEIDVSAFSNTFLSVNIGHIGDLMDSDYIDVYWRIVGVGNFILIDDNNSGHTVEGLSTEDCWTSLKVFKNLTVTTPDKVQIRVVFNSNSSVSKLLLKKVEITGTN